LTSTSKEYYLTLNLAFMINFPKEEVVKHLTLLQNDPIFQNSLKTIVGGRFARDPETEIYKGRLHYTEELRKFMYNPALLNIVFSDEQLKSLFFRTFGYKGNLNFRIYPNAWLRDLPLLDIGENAYLADGIVLGSNQVSQDQRYITVGKIKIGANTVFDQNCALGYGTTFGTDCTIGYGTSIGIKNKFGDGCKLGEVVSIGHGSSFGKGVVLDQNVYVGNMCKLDDEVQLASGTNIPHFSHVTSEGVFNRRTQQLIAV
jgi:acetyltransferase-like isoleucine patch superfamily enzyme